MPLSVETASQNSMHSFISRIMYRLLSSDFEPELNTGCYLLKQPELYTGCCLKPELNTVCYLQRLLARAVDLASDSWLPEWRHVGPLIFTCLVQFTFQPICVYLIKGFQAQIFKVGFIRNHTLLIVIQWYEAVRELLAFSLFHLISTTALAQCLWSACWFVCSVSPFSDGSLTIATSAHCFQLDLAYSKSSHDMLTGLLQENIIHIWNGLL